MTIIIWASRIEVNGSRNAVEMGQLFETIEIPGTRYSLSVIAESTVHRDSASQKETRSLDYILIKYLPITGWTCVAFHMAIAKSREIEPFKGRPRKRWLDNVTEDCERRGWDIVEARHLAADRQYWKSCIRLTQRGLASP